MKKLRNIINKIIILTFTISLIVFSMMPKEVQASSLYQAGMSEMEIRTAFVNELINFLNTKHDLCSYPESNVFELRNYTYNHGIGADGKYHFDCVGWVNYAFKYLGLNIGPATISGSNCLVNPKGDIFDNHFTKTSVANVQIGDILMSNHPHVAIYIGNNQVIDMYHDDSGGLGIRSIGNMVYHSVAHLSYFEDIVFSPVPQVDFDTGPGIFTDFKPQGEIDDKTVNLDKLEFEFAGSPSEMQYNGEKELIPWNFSKISQFIDYILGIMIQAIKGSIVGWTAIVEDWVNSVLIFLSIGK